MRRFLASFIVLLLFVAQSYGQTRAVTGTVRDAQGNPVPFATVLETGTKNAASADANGNYTIKVGPNARLTITATGFTAQTSSSGGDITLVRAEGVLQEVVVTTALGIKRQSKELGYAATSINNKTLTAAKSVNVQQALNGKISGLSVTTTNSGVFENAKINIRGIRSLTGNNQPLLVVDGSPTPLNYLSSIPPDDVQDITVLKSSASAAIYGPDAVNGVILVTTKKGTGNKLSVTVSSAVEAARVAYFPKLQHRFGQGAGEVVDAYGNYGHVEYENQLYGPEYDGSIKPIGPVLEDGSQQSGPYTNAHKSDKTGFFNTGLTTQNSISVAGQDFYFSVNDAKIKGLMPGDENRRTSFRFNSGKKVGKFSVNYNVNYTLGNYNVVNEAGVSTLFPSTYGGSIFFGVLQTADNVPLLNYKDWQNDKFSQYSNYFNGYSVSPYWSIGNVRQRGRSDNLIGNLDVNYQLFPWLKASARLSTNLSFTNYKNTTAPIFVTEFQKAHRDGTQYGSDRPGSVFNDENTTTRINLEYFLNGDRNFGDFSVKYIAGGLIRQDRTKDVAVGGNNLSVPYLYNVAVRSGDANVPLYPNNAETEARLYSVYGSASFGYKGWAFAEFTGRNDWDSRLIRTNRTFFYPGANAALVLSDALPSLKTDFLSFVKLRGSIAKSGNVNVPVFATNATFSQPAGFPYGNTVGFTANNTIPSPDLKPEFVITKEAGIELGFLRNRINIAATYFLQNCNNQILTVSQSATTGYTSGLANAADFKNYGVETELNLTPLVYIGKGRINLNFNATYNNNEVLKTLGNIPVTLTGTGTFTQTSGSSPTANNIAIVGMPAFAFQLTDYNRDSATGKVIVSRTTGLPSLASQQVIKGRSLPLWVLGVTPSYTIGNFSVSMTWDYKTGHDFYAGIGSDMDFSGISERSAQYGRKRFVFPNSVVDDGTGKLVPNTNIQVQDGNYSFWATGSTNTSIATNYFSSAAAWRLREVNISYNIPKKWLGSSNTIKGITVSAIAKNLLLFVPKSNQWGDPEFNSATGANTFGLSSSFQSPASRLFGGTVTVQF